MQNIHILLQTTCVVYTIFNQLFLDEMPELWLVNSFACRIQVFIFGIVYSSSQLYLPYIANDLHSRARGMQTNDDGIGILKSY